MILSLIGELGMSSRTLELDHLAFFNSLEIEILFLNGMMQVCIYWMGIIPWARNNRFCHMGRRFTTAVPLDLPSSI
ncbi:unnamed protein product, partial [Vitis vinifera]